METQDQTVLESLITEIEALPDHSPIRHIIYSYLQRELAQKNLKLQIHGHSLKINEKNLDLSRRKKILRVFEIFLSQTTKKISRFSLIEQIYSKRLTDASFRQQSCYNHNVVKLISRARHLVIKFCQGEHGATIHWFPYDPCSRTWQLYSIKDDYI